MQLDTKKNENESDAGAPRQVLIVLTDELDEPGLIDQLQRQLPREWDQIMVVAPAVEETPLHHALGDIDTATREAQRRLESSLEELRSRGYSALGHVGDADPIIAAEDALRLYPADEVLIVAHSEEQKRWFEDGLFDRAREQLYPAVRMVVVRHEEGGEPHLADVKHSGPGRKHAASERGGDQGLWQRIRRRLAWG